MAQLFTYTKVVDAVTTHYLRFPELPEGQQTGQELCTLADGRTVVAVFDGFTLPADQPATVAASLAPLTPTAGELEDIKAASPIVQLIYADTEQRIRSKYSASDEAKYARIGVGVALGMYAFGPGEQDELIAFGTYVEQCRTWGRAERAKFGL